MTKDELKPIIEAIIFAADHPVGTDKLCGILEGEKREDVKDALFELVLEYKTANRGFYIEEVAGGFQMRTNPSLAPWIKKLFKIGLQKVSRAALETLAIVAYKQPLTRAELEAIRGVDSAGVLKTLLERRLVRIVGRKEEPGRPVVYGTTKEFLETFNLKDLSSLPTLKDIESLTGTVGEEFETGEGEASASGGGEITKDNIQGGDNVAAEGGGTDNSGQGSSQP
ncbi:MAG: SMC-Scp complex subunit ScpB [Thermodesulfobacteriota bacterium]